MRTVTLVTGDQVTVTSTDKAPAVKPGAGRTGVTFQSVRAQGHLYVMPSDAARLVASGLLDRRLFDVTTLVRFGYDDASTATVPLIIKSSGKPGSVAALRATNGLRTVRDLPKQGSAAVRIEKSSTLTWWSALTAGKGRLAASATGIERIWLDGKRFPTDEESTRQIGAPDAWAAGFTGAGITVAVVDTGVDASHPDLVGTVVDSANFTAAPTDADEVGHGTHVASIIAGSGRASNGAHKGVAPGAKVIAGKVCQLDGCEESAILAGLNWAVDKHARVVNLSLGGGDTPDIDLLEQAINELSASSGTLFVVAAGNSGPMPESVSSPGSADAALTVGAVDDDDAIAVFSSRGPRIGDAALKPDITAPGVGIIAARAKDTEMGEPVGTDYVSASGTSMATPHVVGAAAIMAQQHPDWTGQQVKSALMASAQPHQNLTVFDQGAGRVDLTRAITQFVVSEPVSVSLGRQTWPHSDDTPVVRELSYRNTGSSAVTLAVTTEVTGPAGAQPPAGMFSLSASSLTVPAGGSASVTLTADTRIAGPDGIYGGRIVATTQGGRVVTPIAVDKEVESYDVTVTNINRDGAPGFAVSVFTNLNSDGFYFGGTDSGVIRTRLAVGDYDLFSFIDTPGPDGQLGSGTLMSRPTLTVDRNVSVTLDARSAGHISITPPNPQARLAATIGGYSRSTARGGMGAVMLSDTDNIYLGSDGPSAPAASYFGYASTQWGQQDDNGTLNNSPYLYSLAVDSRGRLPQGATKRFRESELATVNNEHALTAPLAVGYKAVGLSDPIGGGGISLLWLIGLPSQRVEYFGGSTSQWVSTLFMGQTAEMEQAVLFGAPTRYRPGTRRSDRWNDGPFTLAMPRQATNSYPLVGRAGDWIFANVPLFSDRAGRMGFSQTDSGRITLYRNGVEFGHNDAGDYGAFEVPAETADYRIVATAERGSIFDLTTSTQVEWTFRSGHVAGSLPQTLPVNAVRFTPRLRDNAAAAGSTLELPITVDRQLATSHTQVRSLTTEVSFDDGKTWQPLRVSKKHDRWVAIVRNPGVAGYASLRATAVDRAGHTVKQTVIHAYRITSP